MLGQAERVASLFGGAAVMPRFGQGDCVQGRECCFNQNLLTLHSRVFHKEVDSTSVSIYSPPFAILLSFPNASSHQSSSAWLTCCPYRTVNNQ